MLPSIKLPSITLPPIVAEAAPHVHMRFLEFFAANIRNPNTRRAYAKAARDFLTWCFDHGVRNLADIAPIHVAAWVEMLLHAGRDPPFVRLDGDGAGNRDQPRR